MDNYRNLFAVVFALLPLVSCSSVESPSESRLQAQYAGLRSLGKNAQGYEEFMQSKTGLTLILIPGGSFSMGSEKGDDDEKPERRVRLSAYFISKFEVTNAQYAKFCSATGRSTPDNPSSDLRNYFTQYRDHPVVNVSWEDSKAYCDWAGLKLPTEAQWEFSARGESGRKYPWGDSAYSDRRARFDKGSSDGPIAVGKLSAGVGPFGTHDQAGNVWEWCSDWYQDSYARLGSQNPEGSASGLYRVTRGGGFDFSRRCLRCAFRNWCSPGLRFWYLGFRPSRVTTK